MENVQTLVKKFVQDELKKIKESDKVSDKTYDLLKYYYGIDCKLHSLKEISKKMNIPLKNIKKEVESAEREIFNLLKRKI